jgi:hypothetical protein
LTSAARIIQKFVREPLADYLLEKNSSAGTKIKVDVDGKGLKLSEPQAISSFEHAEDVWILPQVENRAATLSTRTPPTEDEIKRIVELFRDLAIKQVAMEEAKYKK